MSILVTGGAGYIGSHCNNKLNQLGFETIILDNLYKGHEESVLSGNFIKGDFSDSELLDEIFTKNEISTVIHFAAVSNVGESVTNPGLYYEQNIGNLLGLLNAMIKNNVKNIIFSSSAATYGEPKYIPIDEKHPNEPVNPYGKTKLMAEEILKDYEVAYGLRFCILRYFNAAGADPESRIGEAHYPEYHLLPLIFQTILGERDRLYVFGQDYDTDDGTCLRDYIHVDDLADAHILAMEYLQKYQKSDIFNLGTSKGYTVLQIINEVEKVTGKKVKYEITHRRMGDPAKLVASNTKALNFLGWEPKKSDLETIIKDAWHWEQNRRF